MGQASARVKRRVKNKFIRALRRVEAQELGREQFLRNRQRENENGHNEEKNAR